MRTKEIKKIKEFQVKDTIEKPDTTPKILLENTRSKKQVEVLGKILEAQYIVGNNFLLLVTEGNPFEEALYIYYFNSSLQIIDSLELSAMYAEGMLRNLSVADSDSIQFSFFENDEQWILKILPIPKFIIRGNKYPVKRRSPIFHRSWLKLKKS
jgi:hypothetical protein